MQHAVIVVAEGAGQELIPRTDDQKREQDESGNISTPNELFSVKYIDPKYMIRVVPANATDNLYCTLLAHSAIHGDMGAWLGLLASCLSQNQPDFLISQA
uniref:Phosphofructokinase domain-containing protein n=1 Tax=Setaria viridis TaxID=4556 RepID=A0A4U6UA00_SETVI|nr:hypothetical protein SEVIR_5G042800v2 [Setaria viridis]